MTHTPREYCIGMQWDACRRRIHSRKAVRLCRALLVLLLTLQSALPALAAYDDKIDGQTPRVVIASDWDFAPYEFITTDGRNDGFNIEVVSLILDQLGIPYHFRMGSRRQSLEAFRQRKADLIIDYSGRFTGEPYIRTLNILEYSNIVVARREGTPKPEKASDLKGHTVALNGSNDTIMRSPLEKWFDEGMKFEYRSAHDALGSIANGKLEYFVWGQELLKWKVKELNLNNVEISLLDFPASEIHIVGYNKELIEAIDDQLARLQQSGKIDIIRDRWFHPERMAERTSPMVLYISIAVLLLSALIYAIYRLAKRRVHLAVKRNQMMEAMMRQALNMGKFSVMVNDLRRKRFSNLHGNVLPEGGISPKELISHIHPDDREAMLARPEVMKKKMGLPHPYKMRWNAGTEDEPHWIHSVGYSFPELRHHRPVNIVIVSRDVTEQVEKEQRDRELTERYMKMFDSTLLAMSFYDKDGRLINLNANMKELCGLTEQSLRFFWTTRFFDVDILKGDFDPNSGEDLHVCQHMKYPDIGIDKYIELRVSNIFDENGNRLFYVVTARDISDERKMYLDLSLQSKALSEASATNKRYEKELHTMLERCNMYVWHADINNGKISFSRSLHSQEFTETFEDYLGGMEEADRPKAIENIRGISQMKGPFNVVHRFNHTPVTDTPTWFAVSGMPLFDDEGNVTSLFGLVRDITRLMEAQEHLREETARAENSAMLKSAFLANMTHEIRTPLNAIVGFSDLLQSVSDPGDRKEFIHIIRNNCDMLMRLINDIFEASTMDVTPLSIVPRKVDFAKEFSIVCQSLAQRVQEPGVKFIADQPYDSCLTSIDMGRLQQVITNFVTNAVKYTHKGHIRVGYCLMDEGNIPESTMTAGDNATSLTGNGRHGLYVFCEDTGTGIPRNKQKRIFDRFVKLNDFVQGTGLGLAICKSIALRCNGRIGLISEGNDKGSTFWIWIPCECHTKP